MRISMFSVSTLEVAWNEEGERDAGDGGGGDDNGMGAEEMRGAGDRGDERGAPGDHHWSSPRKRGPSIHRWSSGYWIPGLARSQVGFTRLARFDWPISAIAEIGCGLARDDGLVRHGERGGFHLAHAPAPAVAEHRPGREPLQEGEPLVADFADELRRVRRGRGGDGRGPDLPDQRVHARLRRALHQ